MIEDIKISQYRNESYVMISFDTLLLTLKKLIALIGVSVITLGALHALYALLKTYTTRAIDLNNIRLELGKSIVLGLEFLVGADIVGSLVNPNYYNIGILGLIVLIRTVLSFFLNRELESLAQQKGR